VAQPKPDWRFAIAYLDAEVQQEGHHYPVLASWPADELLYYGRRFPHPELGRPLRYEHNRQMTTLTWLDLRYPEPGADPCAVNAGAGESTFYLLHNHHWSGDFATHLAHALSNEACRLLDVQTAVGLTIYKFRVVAGTSLPARALVPSLPHERTASADNVGLARRLLWAGRS
jgi:hypothetical protein